MLVWVLQAARGDVGGIRSALGIVGNEISEKIAGDGRMEEPDMVVALAEFIDAGNKGGEHSGRRGRLAWMGVGGVVPFSPPLSRDESTSASAQSICSDES